MALPYDREIRIPQTTRDLLSQAPLSTYTQILEILINILKMLNEINRKLDLILKEIEELKKR